MNVKSSAYYQREHRKRLREKGLVKKEIWIRPEHANKARALEKELRLLDQKAEESLDRKTWLTTALYKDLLGSPLVSEKQASLELIDGANPVLHIVMHEYGDLPAFLSVAGEQIIIESVLWPLTDVINTEEFNTAVLRTHKYIPLSTICLERWGDQDYYLMFGALSAASNLVDVVQEIQTLASNVIQATEIYAHLIKPFVNDNENDESFGDHS